ncbi:MAG: tRNA-intron lyase [Cenarchaeum sp. SB0665_bin_23]|nr:tRNA-intron lyase [Cenarchaeum sp. SB0667_bin_13]MXY61073.1 tRNA-intron lyase [Cenarchaeum sp. SB0665_bin_23]MXZ94285.1 tRNA-intron lyase [Cenarchaeum sp. SB0666_bin_15]MYB47643.1 tRNA-intron lyase [Cenarchaeum sp. SB0662_bin_33]MYC80273.1 tRNA-intron lyase [Cenarchaeum sp. SB0661_bin_35]MYD58449.1 tRNA-intron lyase [Cenarchaeum sp. SB0678_bin_8]MYG32612.1 tRNA-intron lyase [Cenarchaeum sp. SB0677_bin_16]MYI52335.1 tRNA-intron lyase [Cenarchaeum sp. SB0673_bin_9]MYJ27286.1 tRNA-intron ly
MKGNLVENRIIIWDIQDSKRLFCSGYYGKPIGIPKPKPDQIDVPLVLDLIEGLYLLETGIIDVHLAHKTISASAMRDVCKAKYNNFDKKYLVYKTFRDLGYVVTPGIKFGCDFAVYKSGPGIDHAPYLVHIYGTRDAITTTSLVLAGRLATTVRKQFILAIPRGKSVDFMALDWWKA